MDWINSISFDELAFSFFAVFLIREAMVLVLPNKIAGPGGWLVDTYDGGCE